MKKVFLALVAVLVSATMFAQCPQKKEGCQAQLQCKQQCERMCVYSPETRAMMQVDRIARVVKDLTAEERTQLVEFYKAQYIKCEKRKETANPMTKEECRKELDAELRRVLGDERYIQYLEAMRAKPFDAKKCHRHPQFHGGCQHGEKPACHQGERPANCPRK